MKKIVVTGLGLFTSIGDNSQTTWDNLINGKTKKNARLI